MTIPDVAIEAYTGGEPFEPRPRRMFDHWSFTLPAVVVRSPAPRPFSTHKFEEELAAAVERREMLGLIRQMIAPVSHERSATTQ